MARTFTPKDAHALMNALVYQATAQHDISVVDTSSFIDAGSTVLATGNENVLNAISILIGKTVIAARAYTGKFNLIQATEEAYGIRFRKISYYSKVNTASGMYNTDLYTNLGSGLSDTDGVGSMWEQDPAIPVQMDFYSEMAYDKRWTTYPEQLKVAFRDEAEFIKFMNGALTEIRNDLESNKEATSRMLVCDRICGVKKQVDDGDLDARCAVNMTAAFNNEFGTNYTTNEIIQEHIDDFLKYWTARIQIDSDRMTDRTVAYHDAKATTINNIDHALLRHTPKEFQRFIYYKPFFTMARTTVLPNIFNPQYLPETAGEGINFWQSFNEPTKIAYKPALPEQAESADVELDLVLGILYDVDALMIQNQFEGAYTTPINTRHVYQNTDIHFKYGMINDYTENSIIYYMADEESSEDDNT